MTESEDRREADAALRERALAAVARMRSAAAERGLDTLSEAEIEAEIACARREHKDGKRKLPGE